MELKDTAPLMSSPDYKERFKAEYYQLKIRAEKLTEMLARWDKGTLNFEPTCPKSIYQTQLNGMCQYLGILELRAHLEDVEL